MDGVVSTKIYLEPFNNNSVYGKLVIKAKVKKKISELNYDVGLPSVNISRSQEAKEIESFDLWALFTDACFFFLLFLVSVGKY